MKKTCFYVFYLQINVFNIYAVNMPMLTTPDEGIILILLFMLDEIDDRREAAVLDVAALEQQQQQQNGQTSSSCKAKKFRRWWVRPWLPEHEREKKGQYYQLLMRELSVTHWSAVIHQLPRR